MTKKICKDIPGYEGLYKIDNYSNIFSIKTQKYLKQSIDSTGYRNVGLNNGQKKIFRVHKLMAIAFLNHKPNKYVSVIDHIDNNKLNNNLNNLQIITQRMNLNKSKKKDTPLGCSYYKGKYHVRFYENGKNIYLGSYFNVDEAELAYNKKLIEHEKMSLL
jgi:hypothetical protein